MFRSVNSIVMAPASTGRARTRRRVVNKTLQMNKGSRSNDMNEFRILIIVEIKLIDPRIDLAPAR